MKLLQENSLFALAITVIVFELWDGLSVRRGHPLWLNPLLWTTASMIALLKVTGLPYEGYLTSTRPIHLLLGPATVSLAAALYEQRRTIARLLVPLTAGLFAGALIAIFFSMGCVYSTGGSSELLFSLAQKSVTTPVAMAIAEKLGGIPPLAAGAVVVTGLWGASTVPALYRLLDARGRLSVEARGFGLGMSSHGIGLARSFAHSPEMGAFAGAAMGLNALLTALLVPLLARCLAFFT